MIYNYHATQNPSKVALSAAHKVAGWMAPAEPLGCRVVGFSEILLSKDEAFAFLSKAKAEGHTVVRGKNITGMAITGFENRKLHAA